MRDEARKVFLDSEKICCNFYGPDHSKTLDAARRAGALRYARGWKSCVSLIQQLMKLIYVPMLCTWDSGQIQESNAHAYMDFSSMNGVTRLTHKVF